MADQKVSDLPSLNGSAVDPADLLYIVDSSAGTAGSKKITIGQFQLAPYSGGTVNGVAYFDGTKVVASGSDLVFDGTNLGVGTAAPGARVHTVKTSAGAATVGAFLQNSDNTLGTEVRLAFAANTALLSSDRYGWIGYVNTGGTNGGALTFATTPGGTPATEGMRLDPSGNLGVGTTSPAEKLTVAAGGVDRVGANISGAVTQLRLGSSGVGDAMLVLQYNRTTGAYQFSEGTNGNTGSPDIAVDAAGNVGIGTSSPTSKLDVDGSVVFGAAIFTGKNVSTNDVAIELGGQRTGNGNAYLDLHAFSGGDYAARFGRTSGVNGTAQIFNSGTGDMQITQFGAAPIVFSTNGSERMRLDSSGNLGVGTNSPNYKLQIEDSSTSAFVSVVSTTSDTAGILFGDNLSSVVGRVEYDNATDAMLFWTAGNERARIDSSGKMGIGSAPVGTARLTVNGPQGDVQIRADDGNVTTYVAYSSGTGATAVNFFGTQSNHAQCFITNNVERGRFAPTGEFTLTVGAQTTPVAVTFSATAMTVNCRLSNVFTTTFTANVTTAPTISNPQDGQTINWFITQDGTGGRTMTWPASFKWPSGFSTTLSTAANAVDLVTATYRSATGFWYASLLKDFA